MYDTLMFPITDDENEVEPENDWDVMWDEFFDSFDEFEPENDFEIDPDEGFDEEIPW